MIHLEVANRGSACKHQVSGIVALREGQLQQEKERNITYFFKFRIKSSSVERDEFSVVA